MHFTTKMFEDFDLENNYSHPQKDFLLLADQLSVIVHRHVLRVVKGLTVQEEGALGCLLLLQAIQREVYTKVCSRK